MNNIDVCRAIVIYLSYSFKWYWSFERLGSSGRRLSMSITNTESSTRIGDWLGRSFAIGIAAVSFEDEESSITG